MTNKVRYGSDHSYERDYEEKWYIYHWAMLVYFLIYILSFGQIWIFDDPRMYRHCMRCQERFVSNHWHAEYAKEPHDLWVCWSCIDDHSSRSKRSYCKYVD